MSDARGTDAGRGRRGALVVALALTGLSMRTAVTSVGAVLDDVQHGLHTGAAGAGVITTLPVLCFAGLGAVTPRLASRFGAPRLLVTSLAVTTAGLVLRAIVHDLAAFVALSVAALAGAAAANVLLPSLVKRYFPDRVGPMTALYTTALAVGTTAAAGLTVPLGRLAGGWRLGIGAWAVLTAVALLPWLATLRHAPSAVPAQRAVGMSLWRSRTAWLLVVFFGTQSMQAYISFGWFARFFTAHGLGAGTAGALVALFTALSVPVSWVAPRVPQGRLRAVLLALCGCELAAYVGLAVAPAGGAWAWMVLAGVGGGTFPVALTLIGLRSRTAESTAALSAFVQSLGYVLAGTGPLLFGALYGATGSWAAPLAVLIVAAVVMTVAAVPITRLVTVDDELAAAVSR